MKIGDVVIIHSEEKNRGQWPLRIVEQLYGGRDGVIRAVKLRTGKSILERPIQHLYPLELSCDDPENVARPTQLDAQAPVPAQGEMRHSRLEFTFATCFKMKSYDSHHTHIDYGNTTKELTDREHLALLSWYFFFSFFSSFLHNLIFVRFELALSFVNACSLAGNTWGESVGNWVVT